MNLALFLTCFNKVEELALYAAFLEKNSKDLSRADVIIYCNNPSLSDQELKQAISAFKFNQVILIRSNQNAGYQFGSFEGLVNNYSLLQRYDVVIHTHQNVYIVHSELLVQMLDYFMEQEAALICSEVQRIPGNASLPPTVLPDGFDDSMLYATDFFAFKPKRLDSEVFAAYQSFNASDIIAESFLKLTAFQRKIQVLLFKRFLNEQYHRELDYLGLWHEHDDKRVAAYLADPKSTALYEFNL